MRWRLSWRPCGAEYLLHLLCPATVSFEFSLPLGLILPFHLKVWHEPMLIAKTPHTTCELLPDWPTATG
jgi:hypothetical protein